MKKTPFKNKEVIRLLNENFYLIYLNGEEKRDITFLGKTFKYKPSGKNTGLHELANQLGSVRNMLAYPTTTILNSSFEIDAQLTGFYSSNKMKRILSKYE